MKKTLAILLASAALCAAQQQTQPTQADVLAAIIQAQQLQSYGDAWAARHGYQYNPWTSYYQWRDERRYGNRERWNAMLNSILDDDH